jgi:hypothetical protein
VFLGFAKIVLVVVLESFNMQNSFEDEDDLDLHLDPAPRNS